MISATITKSFNGKNVLVTGGTGLIGRQIVQELLSFNAKVTIVSLDDISINNNVNHIKGDLCDFNFCKEITQNQDYIFHLAGIKGSVEVTKSMPASFFVNIAMMNTNVLEASRINKIKKLVYTSSIGAYTPAEILKESEELESSHPMDFYPGWAKRMAEIQVKAYQAQYNINSYAVVRLCNVYGPGDNFDPNNAMVIPSLIRRIFENENPLKVWGDGSAIRDFAYSQDVAQGIILALFHGTNGRYLNLASGVGVSIKELIQTLNKVIPFNYEFDTEKSSGFPRRIMNIDLAKNLLGFNPQVSLYEGLKKTVDWYQNNQSEFKFKKNYFTQDEARKS